MASTATEIESRLQRLRQQPGAVTGEDLRVLADALKLCGSDDDNGLAGDYAELAEGADLQQDIAEALADLPVSGENPTLAPLLETFERDDQFYEAMHALLAMAFERTRSERIDPANLDSVQVEVSKRLAETDAIWQSDMTLRERLAERGLPSTKAELVRMLANS